VLSRGVSGMALAILFAGDLKVVIAQWSATGCAGKAAGVELLLVVRFQILALDAPIA
jgi:hypothetical protein